MIPLQSISIITKNASEYDIQLKYLGTHFVCELSVKKNNTAHDTSGLFPREDNTFRNFIPEASSASEAYKLLISKLNSILKELSPTDSIQSIDNPLNTEFITAKEQHEIVKSIVQSPVVIKVNGNEML
jgi:hypothetical protein